MQYTILNFVRQKKVFVEFWGIGDAVLSFFPLFFPATDPFRAKTGVFCELEPWKRSVRLFFMFF
jgi:hypothetical protein